MRRVVVRLRRVQRGALLARIGKRHVHDGIVVNAEPLNGASKRHNEQESYGYGLPYPTYLADSPDRVGGK